MPITHIDQLDLTKTYTYADYLTWQLQERLELLRGKIALMSPAPRRNHQMITGNLYAFIWTYLRKKSCQVFIAPFDVRLPNTKNEDTKIYTVVQPDVCVVCDPSKLDERGCVGAPDLVIEVLSPGNTRKEMREKYALYEEAGVKEYWLVIPHEKTVLVYSRNADGIFVGKQPLTDQETLETAILPDLTIDLKEVFEEQ